MRKYLLTTLPPSDSATVRLVGTVCAFLTLQITFSPRLAINRLKDDLLPGATTRTGRRPSSALFADVLRCADNRILSAVFLQATCDYPMGVGCYGCYNIRTLSAVVAYVFLSRILYCKIKAGRKKPFTIHRLARADNFFTSSFRDCRLRHSHSNICCYPRDFWCRALC